MLTTACTRYSAIDQTIRNRFVDSSRDTLGQYHAPGLPVSKEEIFDSSFVSSIHALVAAYTAITYDLRTELLRPTLVQDKETVHMTRSAAELLAVDYMARQCLGIVVMMMEICLAEQKQGKEIELFSRPWLGVEYALKSFRDQIQFLNDKLAECGYKDVLPPQGERH